MLNPQDERSDVQCASIAWYLKSASLGRILEVNNSTSKSSTTSIWRKAKMLFFLFPMLQFDTWLTGARQVFTMGRESALWPEYPAGSGNPSKGEMNAMLQKIQRHAFPKRWKMLLAGMVMLVPTLLAACDTGNGGAAQLDPHQILVMPNTGYPFVYPQWHTSKNDSFGGLSLDPAYVVDVYSLQVMNMIQVQLYNYDNNMNIIPDAADGMPKITDGGKTYTITLKDNLQWSDGKALTSVDFAQGILHDLDPRLCDVPTSKAPYNKPWWFNPDGTPKTPLSCAGGGQDQFAYLQYIQGAFDYSSGKTQTISGIDVSNPKQIVFHLTQPIAFFLGELTTAAGYPIESSVFKQYGDNFVLHYPEGVGQSGPFTIRKWYNPNDANVTDPQHSTELIFVPNPHWFGKPVQLREVDMPLVVDLNKQYDLYTSNQADYAQVPSHEYPFTENLADFHQIQSLAIDYFGVNRMDPPFDNKLVRQAFALALNKQLLVDSIFQGARTPTNHLIPLGIPGYNPNLVNPGTGQTTAALTGDQDTARSLIKSVADGCQNNYKDWCPYIIGRTPASGASSSFQPVNTVPGANANCPSYLVGVQGSGATLKSTQLEIDVYSPEGNPDRVRMTQAAAEVWSNVLCLNTKEITESFGTLIGDIYSNSGLATPEPIWTLGYVADYPDAEDFTTLQFDPQTPNDNSRVGFSTPDSNDSDKALVQQMYQADVMQDPNQRIAAYQSIEQALVNDVAWIPYDQQRYIYRLRPYVKGFFVPADEIVPDQSWPNVYITSH